MQAEEPPSPGPPEAPEPVSQARLWMIAASVMLATFMVVLDS